MPASSSSNSNPWTIAFCVALAAFMEILDTSIANVALPYMAGNLAVTNDESTWVLTTYLVSNAIVLPISGWLANRFGRKRFFLACIALFTLSSILCGLAPSLPILLLARTLQGAGGGGLQPVAQAIMADSFPPEKRGQAFALYGLTAVFAPAVGPTLGGWLTFSYSWRWIFFINLPMGILTYLLVNHYIQEGDRSKQREKADQAKPEKKAGSIDYVGFGLLTIGIAALQITLDRGQQDDWFGSPFITTMVLTAAIALPALALWEWFHDSPIVDVKLFKNFNFAAANLMMFFFGVVLFGSIVMMPQFLQTLMGYTAELAGIVLSASGVVLFLEMPFVGMLTKKVQARYLIAAGWLMLALGLFYTTQHLELELSFGFLSWMRVLQVPGMAFLFVPITLASYVGLPKDKSNTAAGLVNFMRNIGASVGTSIVTTLVARRSQVHQDYLSAHTGATPNYDRWVATLASHLQRDNSSMTATAAQTLQIVYRQLQNQSKTLAYIDTYYVLTLSAAIMFFCAFILKGNNPAGDKPAAE